MRSNAGEEIRAAISGQHASRLEQVETFDEIDSTNSYLLNESSPATGFCRVAIADRQTAGRGRRENEWHSPASSGLYLSIAYTFSEIPQHFSCLTLSTGVGIANALKAIGVDEIKLKWPNDLILFDGKLGGILTELQPGNESAVTVVTGIGLNIDVRGKVDGVHASIGRISDLREALKPVPELPSLASTVIDALIDTMVRFDEAGFAQFHEQWPAYDWLASRRVNVDLPLANIDGVVEGIDLDGALLLKAGGNTERVVSGNVRPLDMMASAQ